MTNEEKIIRLKDRIKKQRDEIKILKSIRAYRLKEKIKEIEKQNELIKALKSENEFLASNERNNKLDKD